MEFKDRLRYLREKNEWTQGELAKKLGYETYVAVSFWEAGKRNPPLDVLIKLADMFGVTLDYLMGRADNEHGLIIEDIVGGHKIVAEVDNRIYPKGWTHDKVIEMIAKLEKLGIKIDAD